MFRLRLRFRYQDLTFNEANLMAVVSRRMAVSFMSYGRSYLHTNFHRAIDHIRSAQSQLVCSIASRFARELIH